MSNCDEPALGHEFDMEMQQNAQDPAVRERIAKLLNEQPFAVLCTQGGGQPYGSVVAYAVSQDLNATTFATPVATRKFRLLCECDRVALVVDSRATFPDDMMKVEAVTATGRAVQLDPGPEFDRWAELLTARHPQLKSFVAAPSSALFRVDITHYVYVTRFQRVHQWVPESNE
jgi:nitroimidazol reductase NimA-like FMN-containing flavoprotein (pyridoxamine 5'-phosphate oxidase superfamily)